NGNAEEGEALGEGQRVKELSLSAAEHENRDERDQHNHYAEEDRPSDRPARWDHDVARVASDPSVAEMLLQVMRGVLDHYDRLIDKNADGDRDPGQRHDVGLDVDDPQYAKHPHQQKRRQNREGKRDADHEDAAEVHQDQEN